MRQDTIPHLFHHNAIVMFGNGEKAKIGTSMPNMSHIRFFMGRLLPFPRKRGTSRGPVASLAGGCDCAATGARGCRRAVLRLAARISAVDSATRTGAIVAACDAWLEECRTGVRRKA